MILFRLLRSLSSEKSLRIIRREDINVSEETAVSVLRFPDDGSSGLLRYLNTYIPDCMASHPIKPYIFPAVTIMRIRNYFLRYIHIHTYTSFTVGRRLRLVSDVRRYVIIKVTALYFQHTVACGPVAG
jgi:hypothetical protein